MCVTSRPSPRVVSNAAEACYGVSWDVDGTPISHATVRPVTEFPLAHPAATESKAKTCMGYPASTASQKLAIPASGKTVDVATGECRTTVVTGGELLLNYDGVKAASGLGKARRSFCSKKDSIGHVQNPLRSVFDFDNCLCHAG